ncbi:MAG: hypothetical protein IPN18_21940 [Ignavibacteriales bacterium]|nr:hypothetical protein [Ignavibacteriales bacterium]
MGGKIIKSHCNSAEKEITATPKDFKVLRKIAQNYRGQGFKDGEWTILACNKAWDDNNANVNLLFDDGNLASGTLLLLCLLL